MDSVLITGGAGFIGSHLADELLAKGITVEAIDDLSTGSLRNVSHLLDRSDFNLVERDGLKDAELGERVARSDVVFHLAASVGVQRVVDRPIETMETNLLLTHRTLQQAEQTGTRVVVASTSEVYGKREELPFSEEDDLVLGPPSALRWNYALSKLVDEFFVRAYHEENDAEMVAARLFNTIGPRQSGDYGMVVPRFVQQALSDEPITVYGDGSQRRAFTWVGDAVDALIGLAVTDGVEGEVYNVGNPETVTILQLARTVKQLTSSESSIERIPFEDIYGEGFEETEARKPDISKLRKAIGYEPTLNLEEMLKRIIAFHREDAPA